MKKRLIKILFVSLASFAITGCSKTYSGEIIFDEPAKDEYLGVEVEAPVLIRNVEMVQYAVNEAGEVELVFVNTQLEPVEGYESPSFPEDLNNEIFYNTITINGYELSEELIKELAYGDLLEKKELTLLSNDKLKDHNLILTDNAYVSKSDEWQIGEIRITYSYIESESLTVKGKITDGYLTAESPSDLSH